MLLQIYGYTTGVVFVGQPQQDNTMQKLNSLGLLLKAKALSKKHHEGQTYGGRPYFDYHVLGVVRLLQRPDPLKVCKSTATVAMLHDIVEDTPVTLDCLRYEGFPENIVDAVDAITKRPGEDYTAYLKRVKENPRARTVKLADVAFNMQHSILDRNTKRIRKYAEAAQALA